MDGEFDVVLEEQREDWALQGLSSFTKLQTQLGAKAAAANMDMRGGGAGGGGSRSLRGRFKIPGDAAQDP